MLLTRASEYALLSLNVIREAEKPVGAEQVATALNIPKSFLAKILQNLAKANILESKRGSQGGFILALDASEISINSIIKAAEGKAPTVFNCAEHADTCPNGAIGTCVISPFLANFQRNVDKFLDGLMLEDILQ
jgi:Rrf2 family protein